MPMPETPELPRTDDPLAALRAGIESHRQLTDAARAVGEELREQPPVPIETTEGTP